jgi:hypothetical protein
MLIVSKGVSMRILIFILFLLNVNCVFAQDDTYKYCLITGYLFGENSDFYASLAMNLMIKNQVDNAVCSAVYKEALTSGKAVASGNASQADYVISKQPLEFKQRIDNFILKGAGF